MQNANFGVVAGVSALGTEAVLAGKKARAFPLRFVDHAVSWGWTFRRYSESSFVVLANNLRDYRWILRYGSQLAVASRSPKRDGPGSFSRECQRPVVGSSLRKVLQLRPDAGEDG